MRKAIILLMAALPEAGIAQTLPQPSSFTQQQIFTHWVENRCIGKITDNKSLISDANASAAAWLEVSTLPVKKFQQADAAIAKGLKEPLTGSTHDSYNVLKCTLIANGDDVQKIFNSSQK
ncbi:hypothetical protein RJ498_003723 [Pluralibacter gergoviae]